jgi:hypothetical protein
MQKSERRRAFTESLLGQMTLTTVVPAAVCTPLSEEHAEIGAVDDAVPVQVRAARLRLRPGARDNHGRGDRGNASGHPHVHSLDSSHGSISW